MDAYLIVGQAEEYIKQLKGKIVEFPFVKIADVRELARFTRLKLIEKTVIVLRDFDKASEEAQNAFLKALEEPQENLTYILTATNIEKILPTIVSRCEVEEVYGISYIVSSENKEKYNNFIKADTGGKLKIISAINKRDEAIEFVKNLIISVHEMFLENPEMVGLIEAANKTLTNLEANGNVTLQLTNFVVNIDVI